MHVSWAAFELLEMLGLLVPSRCLVLLEDTIVAYCGKGDVLMCANMC